MYIYVCRGLPASGKSYWSKYLVGSSVKADNGQACRLNKDDLRAMLHGSVYNQDNEKMVRDIWRETIRTCINHGRTLIIDDCNLNPLHMQVIKKVATLWSREFKVPVKVQYMDFKTNIETCIRRDKRRSKPVGEKVIRDMAKRYEWETDPSSNLWDKFKSFIEGKK